MAVIREERSNSKIEQILPPIAINADKEDIAGIDVSGFDSLMIAVLVGTAAVVPDDQNNLIVKLQHSDDNANFEDCKGDEIIQETGKAINSNLIHVKAAPDKNSTALVAYIGPKRYVRSSIKVNGNLGDGVIVGVAAILNDPKYRPLNQ